MNISLFLSRFIYKIRYQLLFCSITAALLVAYFTQFLPKSYTVETTIYTGIVSSTTVIEGQAFSSQTINNTYDNLINLIKSKSTLENVSMNLLAMNLIYGNSKEDNVYITANNYISLENRTPDEVKALVDKKSVENTVERFKKMKSSSTSNFLYTIFNGGDTHYSYQALSKVISKRIGNSDMIEISLTNNDPGITTNTVRLISQELIKAYDNLRYRATDDAISYFEKQVKKYKRELHNQEVSLSDYNIKHNIINYGEQTKATAISFSDYENKIHSVKMDVESSKKLMQTLEYKMDLRGLLMKTNKNFLKELDKISVLSEKKAIIDLFADNSNGNKEKKDYEQQIDESQRKIKSISTDMNIYQYSKEGVGIKTFVDSWVSALLQYTKSASEYKVLKERKAEYDDKYREFSPIGTEIKSREREISVTERTYLEMIDALNTANLRKRNIQLTTAGLDTITDPSFPLSPNSSKRIIFIIAAFIGSIVFIIGYKLLIELLDRTLRDAERATRLSGISVAGVFSGRNQLRYRGYSKTWNRRSAEYFCNRLNAFLKEDNTAVFNLFSIEKGEGKSYIARYIVEEWEKQGLKVKYLKAGDDFLIDSNYLLATDFSQLYKEENGKEQFDILLIEYSALQTTSIPPAFLLKASANILIANACRVWKKSDDEIIAHLDKIKEKASFIMCLNNTNKDVVEDFTGNLPPYNTNQTFSNKMQHMGLTAKNSTMKRF